MLFKGGRETLFRGRASYVVVAVLVGAFVLLLAAPAWSKDDQSRKEDSGAGETKTQGSSAQTDKKESGSKPAGNTASRNNSKQERSQASGNDKKNKDKGSKQDPIAGAEVRVKNGSGDPNVVDKGDVLTIQGDYKVEPGASVTLEDKDGTQAKFSNSRDNADIPDQDSGDLSIKVTGDPEEINTSAMKLKTSAKGKKSKKVRAAQNGQGHRGRRGGKGNCVNKLGSGASQYDVVQICKAGGGGGGRNGRGGQDLEIEVEEETTITETTETIEERSADSPDGAVADTSSLDTLPNTGGPSFLGGALVPALALLTAGAGFSVWRFGGGRSRRDDD